MSLKPKIITARETSDGEGVKIYRSLGKTQDLRLDPFLMLDEFCSENPDDYIGGFPPHPHRGFETITYMIEGRLRHEDSMGNSGELNSGEIQWMTAGRGIIHSEMPLQKNGLMKGFQLWVNLPKSEKMQAPKYTDIKNSQVPCVNEGNVKVKIIAGNYKNFSGPIRTSSSMLEFYDVEVRNDEFVFQGNKGKNYFLYPFEGFIKLNGEYLYPRNGISFSERLNVNAESDGRFLLFGGAPLNERIVQHGPFVMNSQQEILQAIKDFKSGNFVS